MGPVVSPERLDQAITAWRQVTVEQLIEHGISSLGAADQDQPDAKPAQRDQLGDPDRGVPRKRQRKDDREWRVVERRRDLALIEPGLTCIAGKLDALNPVPALLQQLRYACTGIPPPYHHTLSAHRRWPPDVQSRCQIPGITRLRRLLEWPFQSQSLDCANSRHGRERSGSKPHNPAEQDRAGVPPPGGHGISGRRPRCRGCVHLEVGGLVWGAPPS